MEATPVSSPAKSPRLTLDTHLLLVLLLALLASWAFWARLSLPRQTDAELHVFRTVELGYLLRAGVFLPRWAPDFYYGYGYPIFNYYAPLSYYLANLFSLALPGAAVFGVKAVFVLGMVGAGLGCYALLKERVSPRAGLLAAALYLFAPYNYLIDPHARGVLAETLAICLLPLACWSAIEAAERASRWRWALAWALMSALLLSHNLIGPVGFAMAALLMVWQVTAWRWLTGAQLDRSSLLRALGLILASAASCAWFWGPVISEGDAVQLGNLVGPGHFDFRNHFIPASELFAFSLPLDLGAVNPTLHYNLGVAGWGLGLAGAALMALRWRSHPGLGAAMLPWLLGGLALIGLILPLSLPLWEALPPMAYIQFPWRLLGPAALCLAVLGGSALGWLETLPLPYRRGGEALLIALPLALALPIWTPSTAGQFGPADRGAIVAFEAGGFALGTTSTGDYLPITMGQLPAPDPAMLAAIEAGQEPDRLNDTLLPAGANADALNLRPLDWTWRIRSPEATTIEVRSFYFDGWRARVNGENAALTPSGLSGFLAIPVPAGESELRVWLGSTPPRRQAGVMSLAGLLLAAFSLWSIRAEHPEKAAPRRESAPWREALPPLLLILLVAGLGWSGLMQPRSRDYQAALAQHTLSQAFEGEIQLIGYDLPEGRVESGDRITVRLYWQASEPVPANYQVFVHLLDAGNGIVAQSDKLNPGDYPTTRWPLDRLVTDPHHLDLPADLPAGSYVLRIGLYDRGSNIRNQLLDEAGQPTGIDALLLSEPIEVLASR